MCPSSWMQRWERRDVRPDRPLTAREVEQASTEPIHAEPSFPAAEHVADRSEVTAADLEAEWLARELYERDRGDG